MRRNASLTQQRTHIDRPLRRIPSSTGVQKRPLSRPTVTPGRAQKNNDQSLSTKDFEDIEQTVQQEDAGLEHDRQVLNTLNNIHEGIKGSVDAACKGHIEIVNIMREIKDSVEMIKTHTPRKNPECEVEMRDILLDIKDELKGLRKDVCTKGNETISAINMNVSTTSSLPLHRRDSSGSIKTTEVVNAIRDLQTVIETPRGGERSNNSTQHIFELKISIDKIVSQLDEILSENKESNQIHKKQETVLLTEIKDALEKRIDMSISDYEDRYNSMKVTHENQFYKFSKILAMYHSAMLRLCRSDNPEAEEEFRKLSEIVRSITDDENTMK